MPVYHPYFDRFPTAEVAEGYRKLKEWYPASKYPNLNAQWDERIRQYEVASKL